MAKLFPTAYFKRKEKRMVAFYSSLLRPGDLCFDIGAHEGLYTGVFLSTGARMVAVEPVPESFNKLQTVYVSRKGSILVNAALGSSIGEAEIRISNQSEVSSLSEKFINQYQRNPKLRWSRKERVRMTTLDQLIKEFGVPAFCKIDVEGFEQEVLNGLTRRLPLLSIEFNYPLLDDAFHCVNQLDRLYAGKVCFNFSLFEEMRFQLNEWESAEKFSQTLRSFPNYFETGDIFAKSI